VSGLTFCRACGPSGSLGWMLPLSPEQDGRRCWKGRAELKRRGGEGRGGKVLPLEEGQICRDTAFFCLCASGDQTRCRKINYSKRIASPRPLSLNLYFCSNQAYKLYMTKFCFCGANGQQAQRIATAQCKKY